MAHRHTHPIEGARHSTQILTARLKGAGAANMTNDESAEPGAGEVVSATRTGAGTFNLVFRHPYPKLLAVLRPGHVGDTKGLQVRVTAIDVEAKTATIVCEVPDATQATAGATMVATDPAATDTIYLAWVVRNSNAN